MPRKALIRSCCLPYHVTNRTWEKTFYSLSFDDLWRIYADQLRIACWAYGLKIHAFVLMSNHYHLLASTPDENLDAAVRFFQSEVSREIYMKTQSRTSLFEKRYRWSLIEDRSHYMNVYRYIYQNPLRSKICDKIADYKFSTLHGILGYSRLEIPIDPHPFYSETNFQNYLEEEDWIDDILPQDQLDLVRSGLRRYKFEIANEHRSKLVPVLRRP